MKNVFAILSCLILITFLTSCSKEQYEDTKDDKVMYIKLDINAMLVVDAKNEKLERQASASQNFSKQSAGPIIKTDALDQMYFSEFSINEYNRNTNDVSKNLKSALENKVASLEGNNMPVYDDISKYKKLEEGVFYMVLIFDNEDNHVGTTLMKSGDVDATIPVRFKEDYELTALNYYRIVAFTFNTKDEKDFHNLNLDPSQTNNKPKIIIPSDKEFFYHNGSFLLDPKADHPTPPKVNVIFLPQTVKVGITVDARGVGAKVKKIAGTFGSFGYRKTANFDLKLNRVIEKIELDEETFSYDFTIFGDQDSLSINRFVYMDDTDGVNQLNNFSVVLKELVLQRDGEDNETTVLSSPSTKSYNFGDINLSKGKYFNGRINLFNGFQIGDVIWSYTNLYYDANAPEGHQHKFRASASDGYKELTDYWNFNKEFPKSEDNSGRDLDPCSLVYPGGWRMPTIDEATLATPSNNNLKSFSYLDASGSSTERDYDYMELVNNEDQKIRFYAFGMRDGLVYTGEGANALFWLTGSALKTQADVFRIAILKTGNDSGDGLIDYPDFVLSSGRGLNIRCVRTLRN